jgi:predicted nuclease of predicted toxin-antitoxin system
MKLLIDMNLSPLWVDTLTRHGWEAVHWSTVGDPHATDRTIMSWARERKYVVFTHDVDFGTLLAMTRAHGPSVIQVRTQNVMPAYLERLVTHALTTYASQLSEGVLLTVDEGKARVRILPIMGVTSN